MCTHHSSAPNKWHLLSLVHCSTPTFDLTERNWELLICYSIGGLGKEFLSPWRARALSFKLLCVSFVSLSLLGRIWGKSDEPISFLIIISVHSSDCLSDHSFSFDRLAALLSVYLSSFWRVHSFIHSLMFCFFRLLVIRSFLYEIKYISPTASGNARKDVAFMKGWS